MNTDRDPIDQRQLDTAVIEWHRSRDDEALEASLIRQGMITPAEIIESFEPTTHGILVTLADGEQFEI